MKKKARNKMLANHMRAQKLTPNGVPWMEAKQVMDRLLEDGLTPKAAARLAATTVAKHGDYVPAKAPVSQAPSKLSSQAQKVARGEVKRDSKGRILANA